MGQESVEPVEAIAHSLPGPDSQRGSELGSGDGQGETPPKKCAFTAPLIPPTPRVQDQRVVAVAGSNVWGDTAPAAVLKDPCHDVAWIGSEL